LELHTLSGFLGTGIVPGGYMSQLARLVRTHRAEGVSAKAYLLWAVASGLLLVNAMGMRSLVFTVLTISQILGCVLIATLATIYRRLEPPGGRAGSNTPKRAGLP
jgi:hypothetical protein